DFHGSRPRAVRSRAEKRRLAAIGVGDVRLDAADRRQRAVAATRIWLVRTDLQRSTDRLAVRRQRQRIVVDDDYGARPRPDTDLAGQQPGAGPAIFALGRRCHRFAVCAIVSLALCTMTSARPKGCTTVVLAVLLLLSARVDAGDRQI